MRQILISVVVALLVVLVLPAGAQIPRLISYQGVLCDATGVPKPDATYTLTFRLYESSSGGSAIWSEQKNLTTTRGLFSTQLGSQVVLSPSIRFDRPYWLSVQAGAEAEMSPRISLVSGGYSFSSVNADTAKYAKVAGSGGSNPWTLSSGNIYYSNGNVGIGTNAPAEKLHVYRNAQLDGDLIFNSPNQNDPGHPGVTVKNNIMSKFVGDGTQATSQIFAFYHSWSNVRTSDAELQIFGRTSNSWSTYLGLTHDGTNGVIKTDVGSISVLPVNGHVLIPGAYNNAITSGFRQVVVTSTGDLGYQSSSIRFKTNLRSIDEYATKIYDLNPVVFDYKGENGAKNEFGLIAEDVEGIMPELVTRDADSRPESVQYYKLIPLLLNEVTRLHKHADALNRRIEQLEHRLETR